MTKTHIYMNTLSYPYLLLKCQINLPRRVIMFEPNPRWVRNRVICTEVNRIFFTSLQIQTNQKKIVWLRKAYLGSRLKIKFQSIIIVDNVYFLLNQLDVYNLRIYAALHSMKNKKLVESEKCCIGCTFYIIRWLRICTALYFMKKSGLIREILYLPF